MHGVNHIYTTKKGGLFPLNNFSEFAGLSYDEQYELLSYGVDTFNLIGDRKTDVECGINAGCKTAFITGTIDEIENGQDYTADSLLEAVNQILK